jgi:hypothetical protein
MDQVGLGARQKLRFDRPPVDLLQGAGPAEHPGPGTRRLACQVRTFFW